MGAITLDMANQHLTAWLEAELAVSTGKSYRIGSRSLERADLGDIRKQISFWRNEVSRLSGRRRKVMRVVPRDL